MNDKDKGFLKLLLRSPDIGEGWRNTTVRCRVTILNLSWRHCIITPDIPLKEIDVMENQRDMPAEIWASSRTQDVGNRFTADKCYDDQTKYLRADLVTRSAPVEADVAEAAAYFDADNEAALYSDGTCIGEYAMKHLQTLIQAATRGRVEEVTAANLFDKIMPKQGQETYFMVAAQVIEKLATDYPNGLKIVDAGGGV